MGEDDSFSDYYYSEEENAFIFTHWFSHRVFKGVLSDNVLTITLQHELEKNILVIIRDLKEGNYIKIEE